jgi:hypothetical protein
MVTRPRNLQQADPYFDSVVLLCPFSGEDGDTTTTDLSNEGHTMTFASNASLDGSIRKFGFTSLLIDDTDGKGVYTPTSAAWANLKIADGFTVEAHVNYSVTGTNTLCSMWSWTQGSTTRSWGIFLGSDGGVDIWTQNAGSSATHSFGSATGLLSANTWHHVVFQCQPAGNFEVFVDGTRVVNVTPTISELRDPTDDFCVGATDDSVDELDGYVENVRITKGVARYTDGFTPPERAYPTALLVAPNTPQPTFSNVVWLMGFEGGTGTGTFTEESNNGFTVTPNGSANRSTTQAKFGTNSGETIGGSTSRFSVDDNAALEPGSSDFSVEGFFFNENTTVDATFFCCWHASSEKTHVWWWDTSASEMNYQYSTNGSATAGTFTASWTPTQDQWYHLAICRNGNDFRMFVDGEQIGTTFDMTGVTLAGSTRQKHVGYSNATINGLNGFTDEFRYVIGEGIYTQNFTVPASPHPRS